MSMIILRLPIMANYLFKLIIAYRLIVMANGC